jgi:hypothetical protein
MREWSIVCMDDRARGWTLFVPSFPLQGESTSSMLLHAKMEPPPVGWKRKSVVWTYADPSPSSLLKTLGPMLIVDLLRTVILTPRFCSSYKGSLINVTANIRLVTDTLARRRIT